MCSSDLVLAACTSSPTMPRTTTTRPVNVNVISTTGVDTEATATGWVPVAFGDAPMGFVRVDGVGQPRSQSHAGPLLPGVMESANVGQLGSKPLAVAHQGGEHAPGFDCAELTLIADQDDLRPDSPGGTHQLIQSEGSGQAGLVHDHQLV